MVVHFFFVVVAIVIQDICYYLYAASISTMVGIVDFVVVNFFFGASSYIIFVSLKVNLIWEAFECSNLFDYLFSVCSASGQRFHIPYSQ